MAAVADDVDHHVALELAAESRGELGDVHHRLDIVAVDMENGRVDHLGDVGAVAGRARIGRQGGEADLVVDHQVDGAAGGVALELGELEGLHDQALPGHRGIAVDQDRHHRAAAGDIVVLPLLAAGAAEHHGVDRLEMAGIGRQGDVHLAALGGDGRS
jgi:hypothetical protein